MSNEYLYNPLSLLLSDNVSPLLLPRVYYLFTGSDIPPQNGKLGLLDVCPKLLSQLDQTAFVAPSRAAQLISRPGASGGAF